MLWLGLGMTKSIIIVVFASRAGILENMITILNRVRVRGGHRAVLMTGGVLFLYSLDDVSCDVIFLSSISRD